ncbi:hypothetical protein IPJ72_04750 [Candidatus Peregrinibacteria bacterium]|nr:MAG: hypothetical protein IPJ72_04750 [Candidatus Peregrinibacteria bacterium]
MRSRKLSIVLAALVAAVLFNLFPAPRMAWAQSAAAAGTATSAAIEAVDVELLFPEANSLRMSFFNTVQICGLVDRYMNTGAQPVFDALPSNPDTNTVFDFPVAVTEKMRECLAANRPVHDRIQSRLTSRLDETDCTFDGCGAREVPHLAAVLDLSRANGVDTELPPTTTATAAMEAVATHPCAPSPLTGTDTTTVKGRIVLASACFFEGLPLEVQREVLGVGGGDMVAGLIEAGYREAFASDVDGTTAAPRFTPGENGMPVVILTSSTGETRKGRLVEVGRRSLVVAPSDGGEYVVIDAGWFAAGHRLFIGMEPETVIETETKEIPAAAGLTFGGEILFAGNAGGVSRRRRVRRRHGRVGLRDLQRRLDDPRTRRRRRASCNGLEP